MNPALAQREVVLAGIALLAVVVGLAVVSLAEDEAPATVPGSVAVQGTGWYRALAAPYRIENVERTICGHAASPRLLGVAHPVLPCGAKIYLSYGGTEVLTEIVDRGTGVPGREFDVSAALARRLGLRGTQPVRWRFASP